MKNAMMMLMVAVAVMLSIPALAGYSNRDDNSNSSRKSKPVIKSMTLTGVMTRTGDSYSLVTKTHGTVALPDPSKVGSFLTLKDYAKMVGKNVTVEIKATISGTKSSPATGTVYVIDEIKAVKSLAEAN